MADAVKIYSETEALTIASEAALARGWLTPEEDEAWAYLSQSPSQI